MKGTRQNDGTLKLSRITSLPEMIYYTPRYVTEADARLLRLISAQNSNVVSPVTRLEGKRVPNSSSTHWQAVTCCSTSSRSR